MTLTNQQVVDTRRYMGYSVSGNTTAEPYREPVYSNATFMARLTLDYRLANLQPEEENTLTTYFLPNLYARERDIQEAAKSFDTDEAGVWKRNRSQVSDLTGMFNSLRRDLCTFLGFSPGPNLGIANRLVRA